MSCKKMTEGRRILEGFSEAEFLSLSRLVFKPGARPLVEKPEVGKGVAKAVDSPLNALTTVST